VTDLAAGRDPEEAKKMGAFVEDAITLEEAVESSEEKEVQ
jgi:hypothetical protein